MVAMQLSTKNLVIMKKLDLFHTVVFSLLFLAAIVVVLAYIYVALGLAPAVIFGIVIGLLALMVITSPNN